MKKRPFRLPWVRWLLFSTVGCILFMGLVWAGVQTRWAKDRLAGWIASATAETGNYRVTLEGINGLLPFSIRLDRIALSDKTGPWLQGRHVDMALSPTSLLAGAVDIKWFRVKNLSISRVPEPSTSKSQTAPVEEGRPPLSLPRILVREIRIDRVDLGEEVAGVPLSYRLESHVQTGGQRIEISSLLQNLNLVSDALRVAAAYDLNTRQIRGDANYHESRGGLLAGLLGLPDATGITLQATADGPISQVKGRLDLDIGGYGKAGLDVEVALDDPVTLTLGGEVRVEHGMAPEDVTAALGGLNVAIQCRAAFSSDHRIELKAFTARTPSSAVSMEGTVDLARGLMDVQATVSSVDILPFLRGIGLACQSLGPVHLTARGPFTEPEVTLRTTLGRLQVPNATLEEITLKVDAAFEKNFKGVEKIDASVTAKEMGIPQVPALKGPLRVDVAAASPDFRKWDLESIQLTVPELVVSAQGARIDMLSGDFSANLLAEIESVSALLPTDAGDMDGRMVLRARAEGNAATHQIRTDLTMALSNMSNLPAMVAGTIGPEPTLDGRAVLKDDILILEKAHLTGGHTELDAGGQINTATGAFDVTYRLDLTDLAPMGQDMGASLSGSMESHGRITGGIEEMAAEMNVLTKEFRVNTISLEEIRAQLEITGLPQRPSGMLHITGRALNQPLQLDTGFAWSGETLTLSGARVDLPGIHVHGDLDIMPGQRRLSGNGGGEITSMELLSALTDHDIRGSGRFELRAATPTTGDSDVSLNADFKELWYKGHHMAALHIRAAVDDMTGLRGRVRVEGVDAVVDRDVRIETVQIDVNGDLGKAVATLEAKGSVPDTGLEAGGRPSNSPVSLSSRLRMAHDDTWRLRLELFEALYRGLDIHLSHPATVTIQNREITLDDLHLRTPKGELKAKGELRQETVQASVRVSDLPMALFEPFLDRDLSGGTVSAECDIAGPLSDPQVHAEAHMRGCQIPRGEGTAPLRLEASLKADRRGDRFEGTLSLTGLDKAPFTATASLPARLSLQPLSFDLDRNADLNGRIEGILDLTILQGLPGLGNQIISGEVTVDVGLAGSLEEWILNGGIAIQNGRYENPATGTILGDINGRLQSDGRALRLAGLTATDGETGTLALEGGIATEAPFPLDADLTFNQATLVRKEIVTSSASGKLDLKGTVKDLDLTGEITLDRTELTIPRRLPPDVVVIPVTEINLPHGTSSPRPTPSDDSSLLGMDLSIQIPARFFVRGRGLDAEFKGQLTAQGPVDNPVIRGTLQVVRGTFQFLTRTFHITHGQIAFDGAKPPVPLLNITTQVNAGQIDAQVRITGPADAFKLTLTSQPPLPQDEILANILFGQSVAKLNAFQAYQLAASISQISGGGIPDIAGKTRSLLGVDRLSISGGTDTGRSDGGPTVSAGKYVSEGVYVGVEQELTDAKQDVVVEVDLTPHFSVESRAGTRSGAGLGFNWKYDY